ncbi:MAG: phage tail protein [Rhodocyclales bacterium]|nr:phage tail protein [Rhodocyclales bacterium]
MIKFSIKNNFPAVAKSLDELAVDMGRKAMGRAISRTIEQGKTEMARQISSEFRLPVGQVKKRLVVAKTGWFSDKMRFIAILSATSRRKGRSMNVIAFVTQGRVSKAAAKRRGDVGAAGQLQFQIKRGGDKKMIKGAFIANNGRTVFIREGKGRLPIKALNTIDVPQMFNTKRINTKVREVMLKRFVANFERERNAVLRGYGK